jgi:hypothetical protein
MFQKTPSTINANFFTKQHIYKENSSYYILNRLFTTVDQTEKFRQAHVHNAGAFVQMPPNNYIYNAYTSSFKPYINHNQYEIRYPILKENPRNHNSQLNSTRQKASMAQNYTDNLFNKERYSFERVQKQANFQYNHTSDNGKKTSFGLKHNLEPFKPIINAKPSSSASSKLNKIILNQESRMTRKRVEVMPPKIVVISADTSAFKPIKNLSSSNPATTTTLPKSKISDLESASNRIESKTIEVKAYRPPAYFQPIRPVRFLLKKKLELTNVELSKLLLGKNPKLPPPFLNTKKLYSTKTAEHETNETKKCNNFKDLKSIGFKIFEKDTYAKDKNEKYPLTICEILIKKSKLDKTETLSLDTNKFDNKSPNIIYSVPSRIVKQKSEAAAMTNTSTTTTTRKKAVDTEILIDRYLHKQRA